MTEPTAPGATPADPGATPGPANPEPTAQPAAMADGEPLGEGGKLALQRERELREAAEKREKKLVADLKKYTDAEKTAEERNTERVAELERELAVERTARQGERLNMAAFAAARKLGFRDPEIANRLLDPSEVQFAEDGTPKNLDALLTTVAKEHPYLVNGSPDSGLGPRGAPATPGQDMNTLIRQAAGRR